MPTRPALRTQTSALSPVRSVDSCGAGKDFRTVQGGKCVPRCSCLISSVRPSLLPPDTRRQSALLDLGFEDIYQETREALAESLKRSDGGCAR